MEQLSYPNFAKLCIKYLKALQEEFKTKYDVDSYGNWFYNQVTGFLTFNTGKKEINFKYEEVGTFSTITNTWKWAWDNENTLPIVKNQIGLVKDFGTDSNFDRLTSGYLESSEEEAWEFTAIAAKLLNGIGVYRPVSNHLLIFMVVLEHLDNQVAQDIKDMYVECEDHEYRRRAFVCKHLNHKDIIGFEEAFETVEDMELLDDDDLQAWCDKCELVRQREGEWNEISMAFAEIKLVCEQCYFEMKELNLGHR